MPPRREEDKVDGGCIALSGIQREICNVAQLDMKEGGRLRRAARVLVALCVWLGRRRSQPSRACCPHVRV